MFIAMEAGAAGAGGFEAFGERPKPAIVALPIESVAAAYGGYHGAMMRAFDIMVALVGLITLLPLIVMVACVIRLDGPGPVIFTHWRKGRFGVAFPCLKFRTMVPDASNVLALHLATCPVARDEWLGSFKLQRDPRITRVGRFLRRSSLDELPQLINILLGHMSVVGPRPIIDAEVARYGRFYADYCSVRPGLTGLWQVSGRNNTSYSERVELDTRYARTKSIRQDLMIIVRTVPAVLTAQGSC